MFVCNAKSRLTVHVEFDGGGDGHGDVVVGGLARQDGVQVAPPEAGQPQLVGDAALAHLLGEAVQQGVVPPPAHLRAGVA